MEGLECPGAVVDGLTETEFTLEQKPHCEQLCVAWSCALVGFRMRREYRAVLSQTLSSEEAPHLNLQP